MRTQRFRADLFYRLDVVRLSLPPLRARREDMLPLAYQLLEGISSDHRRPLPAIGERALRQIYEYPWPGNVRELRNVLTRAVLGCSGDRIEALPIPEPARALPVSKPAPTAQGWDRPLKVRLREIEEECVRGALDATDGNVSRAARLCGDPLATFTGRLDRLGLRRPRRHARAPAEQAPRDLLVVDDNPAIGRALARLLAPAWRVTNATDGAQALGRLSRATFDAVLCDLVLPDIDGARVYERAAAKHSDGMPPFLFLTALDDDAARAIIGALPVPILHKPVDAGALRAALAAPAQ